MLLINSPVHFNGTMPNDQSEKVKTNTQSRIQELQQNYGFSLEEARQIKTAERIQRKRISAIEAASKDTLDTFAKQKNPVYKPVELQQIQWEKEILATSLKDVYQRLAELVALREQRHTPQNKK